MKISEFIAWLATQDQDATVEILVGEISRGYGGENYSREDFDLEKHVEYIDMRGNKFAVGKPYENARTLFLGSD